MRSSLWDRMDINKLILVYVQQSDDHALWSPLSILLSDGKCIFFFLSVTYLCLERCSLFHWFPLLDSLSVQLSVLILNVTSFHTPRQRPSSLNISMSFSGLLASWLLPFLKAALMPETPDLGLWIHFPAAFKQPQKFWELIFPSDLISCPPWPQPPTKVVQCCLWDQSHVSWRLLEHGCYLLLLHLSSSPFIS